VATQGQFFDPTTGAEANISLRREAPKKFRLLRDFGYRDPAFSEPFIVPASLNEFETDLASVPWIFAWVVPGLGTHLPAVLLHDALVVDDEPPTHDGPPVSREEADRVFRDAMKCLGTPLIRRWLIWAGASLGTAWKTFQPRAYWRVMMVTFFVALTLVGALHTLDLFDAGWRLPWMGDRSWTVELPVAALLAAATPVFASVVWGRHWRIGAIDGLALAVLLPPTIFVVLAFGVYWVLESVFSRPEKAGPNIAKNVGVGKYAD